MCLTLFLSPAMVSASLLMPPCFCSSFCAVLCFKLRREQLPAFTIKLTLKDTLYAECLDSNYSYPPQLERIA